MITRKFKKGDRVINPNMGKGTVIHGSYSTRHGVDWVCVKCDDFLGQEYPLCGEDSEWEMLNESNKSNI